MSPCSSADPHSTNPCCLREGLNPASLVRALKRALQEGDKFTLVRVKHLQSAEAALSQIPGFGFPFVHLKNREIWAAVSFRLGLF